MVKPENRIRTAPDVTSGTNKLMILVRHPAPFPTESLFGYILRLSQDNGYTTPWSLLVLADMRQHEIRISSLKISKVARIANCSIAELEAIAYSPPAGHPRWCRLLGHALPSSDLNSKKPQFCPRCVREQGFLEAHWDLALMTACPLHQCQLLSACPQCGKGLRWFRPGLLECRCGADWSQVDLAPISLAEAALLDVVRRKVLGLAAAESNPVSLPIAELSAMNLRSLLAVISSLGKHRLRVEGGRDGKDKPAIVSAAARVLADWPEGFFALLRAIGEKIPPHRTQYRILVDREQCSNLDCSPGPRYQLRAAAAMIGLPGTVLRSLKASCDYQATSLRPNRGFYQQDLDIFTQKLLALEGSSDQRNVCPDKCMTLSQATRGDHHLPGGNASIVRAVLSKKLPVVGNLDGTAGGVLLSREEFQRYAEEERARSNKKTRTPSEVARTLDCDKDSIPGLVGMGLLRGEQAQNGLRITEESIAEFKQSYLSLVFLARAWETSSRALMSYCREQGIPMIMISKGPARGGQPFIRIADRNRVASFRAPRRLEGS